MAAKKKAKKIAVKKMSKKSGAKKAEKVAKTTKAAKAPKKRQSVPPTSGQSGPPLQLTAEGLNDKEILVLKGLNADINPLAINALASSCFAEQPSSKANSWVRNSLRRLVRGSWVTKVGKGTYRLTDTGREFFAPQSAAPELIETAPQSA